MKRTWIKIYVDQCLRGTMMEELQPAQRWIWIGFLLLAGDSNMEGMIYKRKDTKGKPIGYSRAMLAELLDVIPIDLASAMKKMVDYGKISVDKNGVIRILNWNKYQSEYARQKGYRKKCNKSYSPELDKDKELELDKELRKKDADSEIVYSFYTDKIPIEEEAIEEEFAEIWKHWPIKASKQDALVAFKALRKKVGFNFIWACANGYVQLLNHKRINENFDQSPMYFGTFLRKERWFDYFGFEYKARL